MPARIDPIFLGGDDLARWRWEWGVNAGFLSGFNYAQPFHLLLADVAVAASTASGETVTLTWDPETGDIEATPEGFSVTLNGAEGWAWAQRALTPPNMLIGMGLPVLIMPRECVSERYPAMYTDSYHWCMDCKWLANFSAGELSVNPAIDPHVLYRGDDLPWSLDNLDGWIPLRPIEPSISARPRGSTSRHVDVGYRCAIIGDVQLRDEGPP